MTRRVGRPAVQRPPDERVPISARIKGEVYNRIMDAACDNDRSLGNELELRLERSFDDPYKNQRRAMIWDRVYESGGLSGLIRYLISVEGSPTEEERGVRAYVVRHTATFPQGPRVEWLPPDKPRYTLEYDEAGKLVSYVELDDTGDPIPATRVIK
jgi:hypothetical protein